LWKNLIVISSCQQRIEKEILDIHTYVNQSFFFTILSTNVMD